MESTLITNATIWTDKPNTAAWLLIENGKIAALGKDETLDMRAHKLIDLNGANIVPGFVDPHTHLSTAAWLPKVRNGSHWTCLEDALNDVRKAAKLSQPHEWLVFMEFDHFLWPEARPPYRQELDEASGGRIVFLMHISLHMGALSSEALRECGINRNYHDVLEDVERNRQGEPNGIIWERDFGRAMFVAWRGLGQQLGEAGIDDLLDQEARRHLSVGITRAHEPGVALETHSRLERLRSRTPLRLSWSACSNVGLLEPPSRLEDLPSGMYGDGPRQLKLFLDGADRCAACMPIAGGLASVVEAISTSWQNKSIGALRNAMTRKVHLHGLELHTPYLRFKDVELRKIIDEYASAGFRLRLHALGNLAVEQATRILKQTDLPAGQATIEHTLILRPHEADDLATTGAIATVQPVFLPHYAPSLRASGAMNYLDMMPLRTLLRAGVPFALSSDNPCGLLDPLANLRLSINRQLPDGSYLQPEQAIGKNDAMLAATVGGGQACGFPNAGRLAIGEVADFVILSGDPFEPTTHVKQTWIDGQCAWSRE